MKDKGWGARERWVGEDPGKEVGNEALARNGIRRRTVHSGQTSEICKS